MTTADPGHRRFRLLDAMILVAATAVGLGLSRAIYSGLLAQTRNPRLTAMQRAVSWAWLFAPCVAMQAVGLTARLMLRPRPGRRRLMRRPGMAACSTVALLTGLTGLTSLPEVLRKGLARPHESFYFWPVATGWAVAAAWASLALGGRWRFVRGWEEWTGLLLGVYFVLASVAYLWAG
jgi:hypothetical protein